MDEVVDTGFQGAGEPSPKKPKYSPKRVCNRVQLIEMPNRPLESGDFAVAGKRRVSAMARGTNQLWIAVEDVEWLINDVAAEVALGGGVPEEEDDSDAEGNCEVQGLQMKWVFGAGHWRADFTSGPLKGTGYTCSLLNMNADKWEAVRTAFAVDFKDASTQDLKEGARLYLKQYCQSLLEGV